MSRRLPLLFSLTLFLIAGLLFLVQPLVARFMLPVFGGTSAVWTTCLVFFQSMLLLGYGYAHLSSRIFAVRRQAAVHAALLLLAAATLPLAAPAASLGVAGVPPALRLLGLLAATVGPTFFVFRPTDRYCSGGFRRPAAAARRSLLSVCGQQCGQSAGLARVSAAGRTVLCLAAASTGLGGRLSAVGRIDCLVRRGELASAPVGVAGAQIAAPHSQKSVRRQEPNRTSRLWWIALSLVPASLLSGATAHLSTDIAPMPLLFVIPLAVYLLSLVLVFGNWPRWAHYTARGLMPPLEW